MGAPAARSPIDSRPDPGRPESRRFRVIACEVFHREVCRLAAEAPRTLDLEFVPKGLHDLPSKAMQEALQARVDAVDPDRYEAAVLVYGLCNNGLAGLRAGAVPLILPRAHDCLTLFLGSRARYRDFFDRHPGCYVLTSGWIERGEASGDLREQTIPHRLGLDQSYAEMVAQYGEDNAAYLWETLGRQGLAHYDRILYIHMGIEPDDRFEREARARAREKGWHFERQEGDMGLLRRLLNGPWDGEAFLRIEPGQRVRAVYDNEIVRAEETPCGGAGAGCVSREGSKRCGT